MATNGYDSLTEEEYINIMVNSGKLSETEASTRAFNIQNLGLSYDNAVQQAFPDMSLDEVRENWSATSSTSEGTSSQGNGWSGAGRSDLLADKEGGENQESGQSETTDSETDTPAEGEDSSEGGATTIDSLVDEDAIGVSETVDRHIVDGVVYESNMLHYINPLDDFYDESNSFDSTLEGLETANEFNSEDIAALISDLGGLESKLTEEISEPIKTEFITTYDSLNEDTKKKLLAHGMNGEEVFEYFDEIIGQWAAFIGDLKSNLITIQGQIDTTNATAPELYDDPYLGGLGGTSASGGYSGSSSGGGSSSSSGIPTVDKSDNSKTPFIESAVAGTLTFSTIVPLFDEMGGVSTIQSSLTGEYQVVGIYQKDDKYYYRVYDKNLKKFYYAEMDENSKLSTEYTDVLKMKEDAMMLDQPNIGENSLKKMTDINEVYFVNGTLPGEGDSANITFVNILDGVDGKNYYVPLSDSVEQVSLDTFQAGNLGNTATNTGTSNDVSQNVG